MQKGIALERIEREVEKLAPREQLRLVEILIHRIRISESVSKKELTWEKLYGIGKRLWEDEDAQEYVNNLRENRI